MESALGATAYHTRPLRILCNPALDPLAAGRKQLRKTWHFFMYSHFSSRCVLCTKAHPLPKHSSVVLTCLLNKTAAVHFCLHFASFVKSAFWNQNGVEHVVASAPGAGLGCSEEEKAGLGVHLLPPLPFCRASGWAEKREEEQEQPWWSKGTGWCQVWCPPEDLAEARNGAAAPCFFKPCAVASNSRFATWAPAGSLHAPLYFHTSGLALCCLSPSACRLAAAGRRASSRRAAVRTAATVTNTAWTASPVTPSLTRDAREQMLGLTVRFSDVSHISSELGAVATAVCKHCNASIRLGKESIFLTWSFLSHP